MLTITVPQSLTPGVVGPPADALRFSLLGPPLVSLGERAVAFRTRKEFALLVYLALARDPRPREHLAALLWPDRDEGSARNLLRTALHLVRQHLGLVKEQVPELTIGIQ